MYTGGRNLLHKIFKEKYIYIDFKKTTDQLVGEKLDICRPTPSNTWKSTLCKHLVDRFSYYKHA